MIKRRFFRYGLRTFLAIISIASIFLGAYMYRVHRQRSVVAWVNRNGGRVTYDFEYHQQSTDDEPTGPAWLRSLVGIDGVEPVASVSFHAKRAPSSTVFIGAPVSDISLLAHLSSLEYLNLSYTPVTDISPLANLELLEVLDLNNTPVTDISSLSNLRSLTWIGLENTQVSDEAVEELKKALPNLLVYR